MRLTRLICIALAALALVACGRRKAAPDVVVEGEYVPMCDYYSMMADSGWLDTAWHDVYVPFKLNVFSPAQVSLSGRATMVRDSAIYLSIRVMGIEGAVALITPDSVYVYDKYHKVYIADGVGSLVSDIGLANVQDALTGQPFPPTPMLDSICWVMPGSDVSEMESLAIDLPGGAQAYCAYGQWVETDFGIFAGVCDLLGFASPLSEEPTAQASIEWNWGNAKFDTGRPIKFKAPTDLPPVRFSDLAPLLMDMQ